VLKTQICVTCPQCVKCFVLQCHEWMNVVRSCSGSERDNIEVLRENPVPISTLSTIKFCVDWPEIEPGPLW